MTEALLFPPAVFTIWWTGVILAFMVFAPLSVYLLHRTFVAARSIRRYSAEALTAAAGIVANTRAVSALDDTIGVATQILGTAGGAAGKLNTIANVLEQRAG